MSAIDGKALWAEVQENSRKLRECKRHRFLHETVTIGQRINCDNCGGFLRLTDIGQYIAGYVAAGGRAADIWPAYAMKAEGGAKTEEQVRRERSERATTNIQKESAP